MNKNELYPKVFTWLFVGLLVTFLTGYCLSINEEMVYNLVSTVPYWLLIVIELGVAIFFSVRISKMSKITASICYLIYSFITGITFSTIFIVYNLSSIMFVFLVTAITFLIFAIIGYTTKKDVSGWGSFLMMALLAVIVTSIVNIFIKSSTMDLIITLISVVIFLGYVIYDMKNVERLALVNSEAGPIYGAFQLYLDFINIFVDLLKLLGNSDN
ncbi:MAG: Bax inhibitor-1/YccA family protein [Bacilli bacterium]|nr:Bax inhibitor-1/YccA family protein [Bacilli bacterium]